jgi:hypothetical protein
MMLVLIGLAVVLVIRLVSGHPMGWYWWIAGGAGPILIMVGAIVVAVWVEARDWAARHPGAVKAGGESSDHWNESRFTQEKLEARQTRPCPQCGKRLRTDLAKQCFECGADWRDEEQVERRGESEGTRDCP